MHTRATLEGERLMVATTGNPRSDFTVTFHPGENGRSLHIRGPSMTRVSVNQLRFDGVIEHIRTPDGAPVRVDREGAVDNHDSQTRKIVERGAIGAALGAIVGAVVRGGGKGAAIGGAIGAGGGAGTVIVEGRDRLDLQRGAELTITSGDPGNQRTISGLPR
jgi:hypothetical protein